MVSAEMVFKGACGEPGEATGPQSNECLTPNAKPSLFMRQVSPALSSASTSLPSPHFDPLDSPAFSLASPANRQITPFYLDVIAEVGDKQKCEYEVGEDGVMWPSMSKLEDG